MNETVHIKDYQSHHTHQNNEVMMQEVYQQAGGYVADDHADDLKYEPAFTTIMDKKALGSQFASYHFQSLTKNLIRTP